jgi:diaminopimelate epimerase
LGVGCDQVLLLQPAGDNAADALFRVFNADGSEVGQCGNGARCAAVFLKDRGYIHGEKVRLLTPDRIIEAAFADAGAVTVNMGVPEFEPRSIPLNQPRRKQHYTTVLSTGRMRYAALSLGNPHAVVVVEDIASAPVGESGAALQASDAFPESVNVGFMQIADPRHIAVRVCERGVGETPACGSGACAAVAAGRLNNGLDMDVEVTLKGGLLQISWAGEGEPIWMTGPAETVFEGRMTL